jgi:DNA-binding GntR family transcriptional regulator
VIRRFSAQMSSRKFSALSASIVQTLKKRIVTWQYPPDFRLVEERLCEEFSVSRSPVREALRILTTNGFIKKLPNRGYAVRQVNLREIEDLYEFRLVLELYVAETLATRGLPTKMTSALRRTWSAARRSPRRKGEELAALDAKFHETLAEAMGNTTLLGSLRAINERLLVFRMIDFEKTKRAQSTCEQHLEVLDRVAAGDARGARDAMRRNITEGRNNVGTAIKEALAKAYALST